MGATGARKLTISTRSAIVMVAICTLLLLPAIWSYRYVQVRQEQAAAAQRKARLATLQSEAEARRIWLEQQTAKVKDADRVRQLYQEIDQLTRLGERLYEWAPPAQSMPAGGRRVRQE